MIADNSSSLSVPAIEPVDQIICSYTMGYACRRFLLFSLLLVTNVADIASGWWLFSDVQQSMGSNNVITICLGVAFGITCFLTFIEMVNLLSELCKDKPLGHPDKPSALAIWLGHLPQGIINIIAAPALRQTFSEDQTTIIFKTVVIFVGECMRNVDLHLRNQNFAKNVYYLLYFRSVSLAC